jgi:AcrR family transcriptional regulator
MLSIVTVKRERARAMAPEERRKAIIDAVVPLLLAQGSAITTKEIAQAAGIAEGTIFRVFEDKRALLLATAEETMNPPSARAEMEAVLSPIPDLRGKIVAVTEHLVERMQRVMLVLMALRGHLMAESPNGHRHDGPPGPPAFVHESNRALVAGLVDFIFEPHRDELRMPPAKAALVMRSLVFGSRQPGMDEAHALTPSEIADVVLHGISREES